MTAYFFSFFSFLSVPVAWAQQKFTVGSAAGTLPNIADVVNNVYNFAFLVGGLLAFGAVVYGALRYTFSGGNESAQSDARDQITQAMLGLLLLLGAYLVLNTLSLNLTSLRLPTLKQVEGPGSSEIGPAAACTTCKDSPAVQTVLSCMAEVGRSVSATTFQGSHAQSSCHFGGKSCSDGSHAIDWGFNAIKAKNLTPEIMTVQAEGCGANNNVPVSCRCETAGPPSKIVACDDPAANHVHCNVDNAACGCD